MTDRLISEKLILKYTDGLPKISGGLFYTKFGMKQLTFIILMSLSTGCCVAQQTFDLVRDFGAKPDNRTDCYAAFKKAAIAISNARGGTLNIPKGKYYIGKMKILGGKNKNNITDIGFSECRGLTVNGNGSTIRVNGNFLRTADYSLPGVPNKYSYMETVIPFFLVGCSNVLLQDLILDGGVREMRKETINEGNCTGIFIDDSGNKEFSGNDIIIKNVTANYFATDGIMFRCRGKNITMSNCKAKFNGRQGLSIVAGRNILIDHCEFDSTGFTGRYGGHAPGAGIDVECEAPNLPIKGVFIKNCYMRGNSGFQIVTTVASQDVHMDSCFIADPTYGYSDGLRGIGMYSINSSLTNSVIFGTLQADIANQGYTGNVAQQFTGNILYSGWRAVVSSDYSRPYNISDNIFIMLPNASVNEYFPYIQNSNCTFNRNIIMMHDSKISRRQNEITGLVQQVREAKNNYWLQSPPPTGKRNAGKYFYTISFDGSRSVIQNIPRTTARQGTPEGTLISATVINGLNRYPLFTAYNQRSFNKDLLLQATAVKKYLASSLIK